MVCVSVREDNPRASESGLLPTQMHEPYIAPIMSCMHLHLVHYEIVDVKLSNI